MKTKYPIMIAGDNFGCGSSREVTHPIVGTVSRGSFFVDHGPQLGVATCDRSFLVLQFLVLHGIFVLGSIPLGSQLTLPY